MFPVLLRDQSILLSRWQLEHLNIVPIYPDIDEWNVGNNQHQDSSKGVPSYNFNVSMINPVLIFPMWLINYVKRVLLVIISNANYVIVWFKTLENSNTKLHISIDKRLGLLISSRHLNIHTPFTNISFAKIWGNSFKTGVPKSTQAPSIQAGITLLLIIWNLKMTKVS